MSNKKRLKITRKTGRSSQSEAQSTPLKPAHREPSEEKPAYFEVHVEVEVEVYVYHGA